MKYLKTHFLLITTVFLFVLSSFSQEKKNTDNLLYKGFIQPDNAARPRVWWHWMNGNVTKDGIRKDLEWMHRAGIGGFQNFDAGYATPQVVAKRLSFMSPDWKDAFGLAAKLADSLHLEMAIAGSPGWSESGGPWVPAKDGMKKYVWSELRVKGGQIFNGKLPALPTNTGSFQNLQIDDPMNSMTGEKFKAPAYAGNIATIAYKVPDTDVSLLDLQPKVTSSGGSFDLGKLTDGDLVATQFLPRTSDNNIPAWIQFEFQKPQTIKALTLVGGTIVGAMAELSGGGDDMRTLEASDDGQHFRQVMSLPAGKVIQLTIDVPPTTARYFRMTFKNPPRPMDLSAFGGSKPSIPKGTEIAEVVLHSVSKVNRFEEQAGFVAVFDPKSSTQATTDVTKQTDVVDLTSQVKADGTLNWKVPAGNWKIVRFGYSLMGVTNHPASFEATGLEVDKLNPESVKAYFTNYLNQYKDATTGLMGKRGLGFMINDSYEAGSQNWTANLPQEFQKRRGYNMIPWLPVLTGAIIKSAEASERFLWDYRKTLAEMMAEYHYDGLTDILNQYGMKRYTESHESGRTYIVDGMDVKRKAAVPMAAMWTPNGFVNQNDQTKYTIDIRESASVSHIYGQNLVAAESFTALGMFNTAYTFTPENLKPTADLELASGLNRFVVHTSAHQPVDDKIPGVGLGPFGQWFTRHETWAEQARVWTDYLARSCYMLQQGKFVADVVYYYGEDNNITNLFGKKTPMIPEGYNYDFINSDALINLLSVKDGKLFTPSGMSYRVLALDSNAVKMPLTVLRKISTLVKAGAVITGVKPISTPSLSDDTNEFNKLVNEIWNSGNPNVFTEKSLTNVLTALKIAPDFVYTKSKDNSKLLYVHRTIGQAEIYWVNNRNKFDENISATFRVVGKVPEIWHAETGLTEKAAYTIANGVTTVSLNLQPSDAVFVVFKDKATQNAVTLPAKEFKQLSTVDGRWNLAFQKERGAPAEATFDKLQSYTERSEEGIKYFSGTATYSKTIIADKSWFNKNKQLWLDLGEVCNLAEVNINGKSLGVVWKQPFRVDVTGNLKNGENKIEIKVTNTWVNRLVGDARPEVTKKITYTTTPYYKASSSVVPAGLLGPVRVLSLELK